MDYMADMEDSALRAIIAGWLARDRENFGALPEFGNQADFAAWLFECLADDASGSEWADDNALAPEDYSNCDRLLKLEGAAIAARFWPEFNQIREGIGKMKLNRQQKQNIAFEYLAEKIKHGLDECMGADESGIEHPECFCGWLKDFEDFEAWMQASDFKACIAHAPECFDEMQFLIGTKR